MGRKQLAKLLAAKSAKRWPKHESYHSRTLLGKRLYDEQCLRCVIERYAAKQASKGKG